MSTITESRTNNIFAAIGSLFSSGVDIENNEKKLPKELDDVLKSLAAKEKEAEQAINVANNSSKKGGFGKRINPIKDANTEKAMRAMLKEEKKNSIEDRERE